MSLPPNTIRIKRKATDEPVEYLRVHEPQGKRQRKARGDYVFTRQLVPSVKAHGKTLVQAVPELPVKPQTPINGAEQPTQPSTCLAEKGEPGAPIYTTQIRRFHMTRSNAQESETVDRAGLRSGWAQPAIFVERKSRSAASIAKKPITEQSSPRDLAEKSIEVNKVQKRPGNTTRIQAPPLGPAPKQSRETQAHGVRLPSGLVKPWNVNSEDLAAEMQAYTLEAIGHNIAELEAGRSMSESSNGALAKRPQSRFKPKKPALRYHERHPEKALEKSTRMDLDSDLSEGEPDDEGDYIIETYVRVLADETSEDQKNYGLLILDSQPDIEKFYLEESDSDEEEEFDEDDENAENHYTADYPDDEVDSDDEFDRDPYSFRTHNASDLEEYDETDAAFSDDEADKSRYPWVN